jgi:hypothetical protein
MELNSNFVPEVDESSRYSTGTIYFIHAAEMNRIKIGITVRSIDDRMKELRTGSCVPLTLLGHSTFQNPEFIEKKLHYLFQQIRVRDKGGFLGEWFYGKNILYHFIWHFANRVSNAGLFPESVLQSKITPEQYAKSIFQVKDLLYFDDIENKFIGQKTIMLSNKEIESFENG